MRRVKLCLIMLTVFICLGRGSSLEVSAEEQEYVVSYYTVTAEIDDHGDFLITEDIYYDFQQGVFTEGYRQEPGSSFSGMDFKSLEGLGITVTDFEVSDGSSLEVSWEYPRQRREAGFRLQYLARQGLQSKEGKNLIDWQAVGRDWEVPIKEADITLIFPETVRDVDLDQVAGDYEITGNRILINKTNIAPGEGLNLKFSLAEQVSVPEPVTVSDYYLWLLVAAVLGLMLAIYRAVDAYRMMNPPALNSETNIRQIRKKLAEYDFDFLEKVFFHLPEGGKPHRGMAALSFELLRHNLLTMQLKTKEKLFGEKTELVISLNRDNEDLAAEYANKYEGINDYFELFSDKEELRFEEIIKETFIWERILQMLPEKESLANFISRERKHLKNWSSAGCWLSFLAALGCFLHFALSDWVVTVIPAALFFIIALGEVIRLIQIVPLNNEGFIIKKIIAEKIEKRRENLENFSENDPAAALELIFNELPWLLLDETISTSKLSTIRKQIKENITEKELQEMDFPGWAAAEGMEGALQALETLDESLATVTAVVAATSTTTTGGGGAGCGGGGAG